jgi:hypothetical protein
MFLITKVIKPAAMGTGMMGRGTGMVLGTKTCICICTRATLICVPAGYIRTHVQH